MAESVVLVTQPREGRGSQKARQLRRQGLIPGVVYGHKQAAVSIALPAEELDHAIRHGARVVDLQAGQDVQKALIKEIQWDHLGKEIIHIDFARVDRDERVRVVVRLEVRGVAPGVAAGGVLDQPLHTLEVECLVSSVPESIRVNINELQLGQAIHLRDLTFPEGVKPLADPDAIVIQVTAPQAEPEAPAIPGAEQAEPEVIGRQKAAEEEEGA
jgi:large subunit ribosomal protein L25